MKSIRIGNDFGVRWTLFRCSRPEPLTGRELTLIMTNEYRSMTVKEFTVEDNMVTFLFAGKDQRETGTYTLTLVENNGADGMFTVDACKAFRLVPVSCEANVCGPGTTLHMESDITVPMNGLSAYELAVKKGFQGTELEWLDTLKGKPFTFADFTPEQIEMLQRPANEAAVLANAAADKANNVAAGVAQLGKVLQNKDNEWTLNEQNRADNESVRERNENARIASEEQRSSAEQLRASAEQERAKAETKRQKDSETAVQNANKATKAANDSADLANKSAEKAEEAATLAEQAKELLFRDMWKTACGKYGGYNEKTGFYELNGLTDITYEEAMLIYAKWSSVSDIKDVYRSSKIRTNIPHPIQDNVDCRNAFLFCGNLEVSSPGGEEGVVRGRISSMFRRCFKLREIFGRIYVVNSEDALLLFEQCNKLEYVNLHLYNNLIITSPVLSFDSVQYLVKNKMTDKSKNIIVTIHPDVYTKLTDETNTEWHAVLLLANEKNISFATEE